MTDATSHSFRPPVTPPSASPLAPMAAPVSEDRRRPKAVLPYICLWSVTLLCVVFALLAMFLQS
ncbi:hypothetical protein [Asticcacaulis sp.]|uniref:hypothetical protein n=1 Tax=Asticcacaulis sp. TaxID=1872648 RepID=UPI0039E5E414